MSLIHWLKHPFVIVATLLGIGCFPLPAQRGEFTSEEFDKMAIEMGSDEVASISAVEIKSDVYHLLDTRPANEYNVSHLPGATRVGYDDFDIKKVLATVALTDTIVVYCSVGYRSGKIGEKLQRAGYKNVYNLEGGLFGWANEDLILMDAKNSETKEVHGFNKKWSKWLLKDIPVVY